MRPDQHKKKKNEQYKKKHNIKPEDTKKGAGKGRNERTNEKSEARQPDPAQKGATKLATQKVTSDDVDKYFDEVQPEFRKRNIQSNWDRYESLPPEEDDAELRGADFQALLDATSNSVAQFQFDDEKDWENEAGEWSKDCDEWLALDVENLSSAMLTIPLHKRLDISSDLFQHEQIQEFESEAARHLNQYNAVSVEDQQQVKEEIQAKLLATLMDKQSQDKSEEPDILDTILGDVDINTNNITQVEENTLKKNIEEDLEDLLSGNATEPEVIPTPYSDISMKAPADSSRNSGEGTDSDILVKDNHCNNKEKVERQVTQEAKQPEKKPVKSSNIEDDLDELLNLDTPVSAPKSTNTAGASELDDWLDSVLDD